MLEVSKLHSGNEVNAPFQLKYPKNHSPTVVILLVSKLPSGKLVNPP